MTFQPGKVIYLAINLESSHERRESLLREAGKYDIPVQIVPAVNGKEMSPEERAERYRPEYTQRYHNYSLTPAEIGCTLSHHLALDKFLESDAEYGVVVEDDVIFQPNFCAGIRELTDHLKGWDVAKLFLGDNLPYSTLMPRSEEMPFQPIYSRKFGGVAVGFMYTRHAAEIIRRGLEKAWLPADSQIYQVILYNHLRIIGVLPDMVRHYYFASTVDLVDDRRGRKKPRSLAQYLRYRCLMWTNMIRKMWIRLKVRASLRRIP